MSSLGAPTETADTPSTKKTPELNDGVAVSVGGNFRAFYEDGVPILDMKGQRLDIPEGEVTALIGPSGCGKTTLLRSINRLPPAVEIGNKIVRGYATGDLFVRGHGNVLDLPEDIPENCLEQFFAWLEWLIGLINIKVQEDPISKSMLQLRLDVGIVLQKATPLPMSIYNNVEFNPKLRGIRDRATLDLIVENALRDANVWGEVHDRLKVNPLELSGGQQQRVGIARALAAEPDILLLDEPTSALDPGSTRFVHDLIRDLRDRKKTIIIVTHDLGLAKAVAMDGKTAYFDAERNKEDGKVISGPTLIEEGSTETIFMNPGHHQTRAFVPKPS